MTRVLITGANRGIGLEFVRQYLDRGEQMLATCRRPDKAAELMAMACDNLQVAELDVTDPVAIAGYIRQLSGKEITTFINNAGVYGPSEAALGRVDTAAWMEVFRINTIAPLMLTQALLPLMAANGKLLYLSSKVGSITDNQSGGSYIYRSSKTALNQVVKSLSVDLAGAGLVVAALHPGWVQTDMGGPNALIDVETSVSGMVAVIDGLSKSQSGQFLNYDGSVIPW